MKQHNQSLWLFCAAVLLSGCSGSDSKTSDTNSTNVLPIIRACK